MDWGTSSCRAYLMGEGGVVLAQRRQPSGTMAVTRRASATATPYGLAFEQSFEEMCGGWLETQPDLPVVACGTVGSNHGWAEADYRPVPADLAAEGIVLTRVRTRAGVTVHIIPGLIANSALPDVMRGEETQILGVLTNSRRAGTLDYASECIVLLPGTHSKWVRVTGTTVNDFTTYMTGEVYAFLTDDSILSRLAVRADQPDWMAFDRGLDVVRSPAGHGGVLHTVFSARSLVITGELAPDQVEDYISGLLIGHELAAIDPAWLADEPNAILLCGDAKLNDRYRRALERLGLHVALAVPGSAPLGMWEIAQVTGLLTLVTL
jgi:2-dehydro-3-deoxygalactonokinase